VAGTVGTGGRGARQVTWKVYGNCVLYQGDYLEILPTIPKVDAIICDPPYGTTDCKWDSAIPFDAMWGVLKNAIKPRTPVVLFGAEPFSSVLRISNIKNYKYDWFWCKNSGTGFLNAKKQPLRHVENIMVFYTKQPVYNPVITYGHRPTSSGSCGQDGNGIYSKKGKSAASYGKTERYPKNIIEIKVVSNATGTTHPTQKPVELMEYLIKTYTKEGETVLDFTMGSGSTGVAAVRLGRRFIGIEIVEKYFQTACERIQTAEYQGAPE